VQKQIFSREMGASVGRFFGETLVSLELGGQKREAVHFALRQMLSLATFELIGQLMNARTFEPCKAKISPFFGTIDRTGTGDPALLQEAVRAAPAAGTRSPQSAASAAQPQQATRSIEEQVKELASHAMVFGARAVAAAEESMAGDSLDVSAQKAAEATELVRGAVQILQRAAELGLSGPEGDAVALVVERGMTIVKQAQDELALRVDVNRGNRPSPAPLEQSEQIPERALPPLGTPERAQMGLPG